MEMVIRVLYLRDCPAFADVQKMARDSLFYQVIDCTERRRGNKTFPLPAPALHREMRFAFYYKAPFLCSAVAGRGAAFVPLWLYLTVKK